MNHTSKLTVLPALTTDLLQDSGILIDNVFATLWQQIGMKTLLNRSGFTKRSGIRIHEVVYTLSRNYSDPHSQIRQTVRIMRG